MLFTDLRRLLLILAMDATQEELNLVEFNIIDNIIGSAVDELLIKESSSHCDYNKLAGLLFPLCRLCARENAKMMHISEVHLQIINDLRIPGIHGTSACTNICGSCNGFLEEFCKFRSLCEEGQKRLAILLTERHVPPSFIKVDSNVSKKDLHSPRLELPSEPISQISLQTIQDSTESELLESMNGNEYIDTECVRPNTPENPIISMPNLPENVTHSEEKVGELLDCLGSNEPATCVEKQIEAKEGDESLAGLEISIDNVEPAATSTDNMVQSTPVIEPTSSAPKKVKKKRHNSEGRRRVVDGRLEWVCLDCEQVFASCIQLKKHRRSCELVGSETSKRFATLICDICGETLSTESALAIHRRKHDSKVKVARKKRSAPPKLEMTVCHVCGHISKSRRALRLHLATHNDDKYVECQVCGKRFKRRRTLRIHMDVHSGRKYDCELCDKKFSTIITLRNHAKVHRAKELQHNCTICASPFAHSHQLEKHMMTHTGEYPYQCEICNSLFRTKGRFKRHMQKGHVLPVNLNVIEQTEQNGSDDLIEYQPELNTPEVPSETGIAKELILLSETATDTLPEVFTNFASSDQELFDQCSSEFTVLRFADDGDTGESLYTFIDY